MTDSDWAELRERERVVSEAADGQVLYLRQVRESTLDQDGNVTRGSFSLSSIERGSDLRLSGALSPPQTARRAYCDACITNISTAGTWGVPITALPADVRCIDDHEYVSSPPSHHASLDFSQIDSNNRSMSKKLKVRRGKIQEGLVNAANELGSLRI